jgi:hypothetical protein
MLICDEIDSDVCTALRSSDVGLCRMAKVSEWIVVLRKFAPSGFASQGDRENGEAFLPLD